MKRAGPAVLFAYANREAVRNLATSNTVFSASDKR
jgi:hypothetical protein